MDNTKRIYGKIVQEEVAHWVDSPDPPRVLPTKRELIRAADKESG
jgi:hypothetical protein